MAGLLDDATVAPQPRGLLGDSLDDPRTMALFAGIQGLLSGRGGLQGIANGVGAYGGTMAAMKDADMKRKYMQAQLDDVAQQAALRKAQATKANAAMDMAQRLMGGGAALPPMGAAGAPSQIGASAIGGASGMPGQAGAQSPQSFLSRLNEDQIMGLIASGALPEKAYDAWKFSKTGEQMQPGYIRKADGSIEYRGDPTKGVTLGPNGEVVAMPGAAGALSTIAGATKEAEKRAEARYGAPVTINGSIMTPQQAADMLDPKPAAPVNPFASIRDAMTRNGDASANFDIGGQRGTLQAPRQSASGPGVEVQPNRIKAVEGATEGINSDWIKNTYQGVQQSGDSATGRIEQANIARASLKGGLGGWGTETKAAVANVLAGLGIASEDAKNYAANAQIFQKVAGERLWSVLNEAKGPQTEGDASRASKTYAQLGNTPRANEFILDMAQAQAERDKQRQRFYSAALPIARNKGDLTEVDREWQARQPSIFDMPTMSKWKAFQQ